MEQLKYKMSRGFLHQTKISSKTKNFLVVYYWKNLPRNRIEYSLYYFWIVHLPISSQSSLSLLQSFCICIAVHQHSSFCYCCYHNHYCNNDKLDILRMIFELGLGIWHGESLKHVEKKYVEDFFLLLQRQYTIHLSPDWPI